MRQKMGVGVDFDTVTPDELEQAVEPIRKAIVSLQRPPDVLRVPATVTTDASGNVGGGANGQGLIIWEVPVGMRADITRVVLAGGGYTPAAPLTSGWLILCRNAAAAPPDWFWPASASGTLIPSLWENSAGGNAVRVASNERLVAVGAGLPANLTFNLTLQIVQYTDPHRTPKDRD